ncbi:MAG TPA: hypothetical protein VHN37_13515 [Actinomycetota bacterium]|nr:hypothetical protein [Actinomycetota bacterium]
MNARASRTGLATATCAFLLLPSCDTPGCRETDTDARDAAVANARDVGSSGVLEARLTAGKRALRGKEIFFEVTQDGGDPAFVGSATTDASGTARLDLKDRPLDAADAADSDGFQANFHGDVMYCSSAGAAKLDLVRTP